MAPSPAETSPTSPVDGVPDVRVSSLYQEIILSHYRAPRHRRVLPGAAAAVEHSNPLCGDVMSIQIIRDADRIIDAAFTARACSITQATASMLLDRVIGATVPEARSIVSQVESLIDGRSDPDDASGTLGDLRALASVARFPARKACVRLVTGALLDALGQG